nr:hypothetical protein [Clostridia bacterium]
VYTGILYLMDLLGVSAGLGALVTLPLGLLSVAVSLKISLEIVRGIEDMETASGRDLHAASLRLVWIWMAVASFASVALLYIAPALSLVSMLLGMAANIVFLFSFHKSKNLFEEFRDRIPTRNPD